MNLNRQQSYLYPIFIGLTAFFVIAGPQFLSPTNVAWLVGGDPLQHYLGWAFYRNSPWTWPVGLNPLYGMEFSNSIVFTDSIPLLAIPFKAISQFLPYPFQYLGIWVLLCFVLQSYFAFRLISLITNSVGIQCLGSILFLFSPPLIFRLSLHESLMGHFIILAALYLNLKPCSVLISAKKNYEDSFAWIILLSIAVMIHFYILVMIFSLWIADVLRRVLIQKKVSHSAVIIEIALTLGILYFVAWQIGYFAIEVASGSASGFGDFRTNLLALFNSRGWSYLLRPIPLRDSVEAATGEGFQYLGTGSLFLLLCAAFAAVKGKVDIFRIVVLAWRKYPYLLLTLLVLSLISLTNKIGIGPWNFHIPLPEIVIRILSLVRSASRLFWPMYYVIILGILYCVINAYTVKRVILLILIAAILQIVDTSAGWLPIREKVSVIPSSSFSTHLKNVFWRDAGARYSKVVANHNNGVWEDFGRFASTHRMATNIVHLARVDHQKEHQSYQDINTQLYKSSLDSRSLYILQDWKYAPDKSNYDSLKFDPNEDLLARIDDFNILAPGWKKCDKCVTVAKNLELMKLTPHLDINEKVQFTKNSDGRSKFLLNGWGYSEEWGTWAIQPVSTIVMPLPKGRPTKILIEANAFLTPIHPNLHVAVYINGILASQELTLSKQQNNYLEVQIPSHLTKEGDPILIEFRSLNPISPKDAGVSSDERKLGIGLHSIQFIH